MWVRPVASVLATFTVPRGGIALSPRRGGHLDRRAGAGGAEPLRPDRRHRGAAAVTRRKGGCRLRGFWSNVGHHFNAQRLFALRTPVLGFGGPHARAQDWLLALTDDTSGRKARLSIDSETQAPFDAAEWVQEDPGYEDDHVEYPRLTVPSFRHLTVNTIEPPADLQSCSRVDVREPRNLGTTSLHDDSFTLSAKLPVSALAEQYLRLTEAGRVAGQSFGREFSDWTVRTPTRASNTRPLNSSRRREKPITRCWRRLGRERYGTRSTHRSAQKPSFLRRPGRLPPLRQQHSRAGTLGSPKLLCARTASPVLLLTLDLLSDL